MLKKQNLLTVAIYFIFHALLAVGMRGLPLLATLHAFASVTLGVFAALLLKSPLPVVYWSGYIVACEILWRMNRPPYLFWEFGKYALSLVVTVSVFRRGTRNPFLVFLYMLLLIPGALIIMSEDWGQFRREVSFNLSGHLALCMTIVFFSKIRLSREELQRLFLVMLGPLIGVGAIAAKTTMLADTVTKFTLASVRRTSGGFGPNQVSAAMGLGVLLAFFYIISNPKSRYVKYLVILIGLMLGAQSALTFSRGGLYNAAGAIIVAGFFLFRNAKMRMNFMAFILLVVMATQFFILPRLASFTGGLILQRFHDTNTTGRAEIMEDDLKIFLSHPVLGVGVGQASYHRETFGEYAAAHTEFTRLLAEHGIFGLFALLILLWICFKAFQMARGDTFQKAFTASFIAWGFLYMANAAMRLALPSYLIGLATMRLLPLAPLRRRMIPEKKKGPAPEIAGPSPQTP